MITFKHYTLLLISGFVLLFALPVPAQFVTIARKIKSKHTSQEDVAKVLIDARTYRVYQAVIDTLTNAPKFRITKKDQAERSVEFINGTYTVSIKVDSLANGFSHITVTAAHSENSPKQPTDLAVDAIFKVCKKVGIKCTLDNP